MRTLISAMRVAKAQCGSEHQCHFLECVVPQSCHKLYLGPLPSCIYEAEHDLPMGTKSSYVT